MECDYGVKDEYFAIESRRGWQPLFMEIRDKSANYSIIESKKIPNRDLNRYRDVNPFDHSRIVLKRGNCSYINASLVKVQGIDRSYILTQGPLPSTVSHFWAMVWEQNCKAVVMLNNTIEKNQVKCHTYWPVSSDPSDSLNCDDIQMTVELVDEIHKPNYILRNIKLTDQETEEVRTVQQYHYTTWPDFGVPATPSDFIQFLTDIRETGGLGPGTDETPVGPAVVHCSAGIGRSGTFCIVDIALLQLARGERVNVKDLVLEMRRYRMGLIQTAEQLRFSYQSIIQGAETLGIDLRSAVSPSAYNNGVSDNPSESDDDSDDSDDDSDDSDSAEEVDEEDDVGSVDSPFHSKINHFPIGEVVVDRVDANSSSNDGPEEPPPPIPPRGQSLCQSPEAAENYDRPLPSVPQRSKRAHEEMESSTASSSEVEEEASNEMTSIASDETGASEELERKRRKQAEESLPRTAESDETALRQRRRQERKDRTQQLISNIKEKQKEQERSVERSGTVRAGSKWVGIGVGLIVLICVGVRYFQG